MHESLRVGTALLLALLGTTACGPASRERLPDALERQILVSAAASLTDAFGAIEQAFEAANPGVDLVLNLAASSTLREQILEGAPVDVFAPASESMMQEVVAAGRVGGSPVLFAGNSLEIAVPAGNPAGITGLGDLARTELAIGLCAEAVPCGGYAREALRRAGVQPAIDTNEANVRALLTKIELGEIDAGIVYASDVESARVDGLPIPDEYNVTVGYLIAQLTDAPHPHAAAALVAFLLGAEGRAILAEHGLTVP